MGSCAAALVLFIASAVAGGGVNVNGYVCVMSACRAAGLPFTEKSIFGSRF